MAYQILDNITGMGTVIIYMNDITGGMAWNLLFLTIWIIILALALIFPRAEAFVITSMFGVLFSLMLSSLGVIHSGAILASALIWSLSLLLLWFSNERSASY